MSGRLIRHAVGEGCPNRRDDVSVVQYLLNCVPKTDGGPRKELAVDGVCGPETAAAISAFQRAQTAEAEGRVEPARTGGRTIVLLNGYDPLPEADIPFVRSGARRKASVSAAPPSPDRAEEDGAGPESPRARRRRAPLTAFVREVLLPGSVPREPTIDPRYARFPLQPGPSEIHRWGVYSIGAIPARRRVIEYSGQRIDDGEVWRRRLRQHLYIFWLSKRAALDGGIGGSGAEAINHSCDPNLYATVTRGRIWLVSRRTIAPGEELTLDYRLDGPQEIACRCGSPLCRGTVNLYEEKEGAG